MPRGQLPQFATYITYEEALREKPTLEQFRTFLSRFSRMHTVYAASLVNALLETWHGGINRQSHDDLVRDAFFPADAGRILERCMASSSPRFVFHRLQALFVAKEALLQCPEQGIDPIRTPSWGGLGLAFLMASDLLPFEFAEADRALGGVLRGLAQSIPVMEYSGRYTLWTKIARAHLMLNRFSPSGFLDIKAEYMRATGLGAELFLALCVGTMSHYLDLDYGKMRNAPEGLFINRSFFTSANLSSTDADLFLGEVVGSMETIKETLERRSYNLIDLTVFRNWPLCGHSTGPFFIFDTRFLAEKLESGIFWRVNNALPHNRRGLLHTAWGYSFQSYINWLLESQARSPHNLFYASPRYEGTSDEVCDGIVVCGTEAAFIEYKGHTFTAEAKYSGDLKILDDEVERHLVGTEDERGEYGSSLARSTRFLIAIRQHR